MRLFLDTHAVIWWLCADPRLSLKAQDAVRDPDNELLMSTASAWEMATEASVGQTSRHSHGA